MKIFKRLVILIWVAIPVNLLLSMLFPWYRRHVPYQIEGVIMILALLLLGAYKIAKVYRAGMDRFKPAASK